MSMNYNPFLNHLTSVDFFLVFYNVSSFSNNRLIALPLNSVVWANHSTRFISNIFDPFWYIFNQQNKTFCFRRIRNFLNVRSCLFYSFFNDRSSATKMFILQYFYFPNVRWYDSCHNAIIGDIFVMLPFKNILFNASSQKKKLINIISYKKDIIVIEKYISIAMFK